MLFDIIILSNVIDRGSILHRPERVYFEWVLTLYLLSYLFLFTGRYVSTKFSVVILKEIVRFLQKYKMIYILKKLYALQICLSSSHTANE